MFAFDFNRFRTIENSVCLVTTRDLRKARRLATRSVISKPDAANDDQRHRKQIIIKQWSGAEKLNLDKQGWHQVR